MIHSLLNGENCEFDPEGQTILHISRKGKLLDFHLDGEQHILGHLGMSGAWRISSAPITDKHTHLQFQGQGSSPYRYLAYVDPRRFGKLYFLLEETAQSILAKLGVDVSSSEFTLEYMRSIFKSFPKRRLKPFLLEQKYFSGIGNYLACEICALAGIHPSRKLEYISNSDIQAIHQAIAKVLCGQIHYRGLSFSGGYRDAFGESGGKLDHLVVFHQKICGLCQKTPVKKVLLAQRGTFYCPHCQK